MGNKSIHRMAHLTVKEKYIKELIILFKEFVQRTRQEKGCLQMELYQNKKQPVEFVFISEFVDVKAFELHDLSELHKELINKLSGKIVGVPNRGEYNNLT
jgi:quinol monooxygenase YgiN